MEFTWIKAVTILFDVLKLYDMPNIDFMLILVSYLSFWSHFIPYLTGQLVPGKPTILRCVIHVEDCSFFCRSTDSYIIIVLK